MLLKLIMTPAGWAMDRFMVRWFGISPLSRIFARLNGLEDKGRYLLLVVTGRKSGKKRAAALSYFEIDGKLLVVGSKGGAPTDPAWVTNLRANPAATVYINRKARHITARIAVGAERQSLWQKLAADVPTYAGFQQGVTREIPLVILE